MGAAKNRLLEAKAELKAQGETKSVLTELIGEAQQTKGAIDDATESILNVGHVTAATEGIKNEVMESPDLFGVPMPQQTAEGFANEQSVDTSNMMGMTGAAAVLPISPGTPSRPSTQEPMMGQGD